MAASGDEATETLLKAGCALLKISTSGKPAKVRTLPPSNACTTSPHGPHRAVSSVASAMEVAHSSAEFVLAWLVPTPGIENSSSQDCALTVMQAYTMPLDNCTCRLCTPRAWGIRAFASRVRHSPRVFLLILILHRSATCILQKTCNI